MPATNDQLSKYERIEAFVKGFKLSSTAYKQVMTLLHQEMNNGLKTQSHKMADIKMFPTFVRSLPDGSDNEPYGPLYCYMLKFKLMSPRPDKWNTLYEGKEQLVRTCKFHYMALGQRMKAHAPLDR